MSEISIEPVCRRRIQPMWMARNGQLVSAQYQQDMATLLNQIARYRSKEYFRGGGDAIAPVEDKLWRFAGHIGPIAGTMVARVAMAPATQGTQTNNPYVALTLFDSSGNTLSTGRAHFGYSYGITPSEAPIEWGVATIALDVSALRDTAFRATLQANEEARPISCTVYEYSARPDTVNGYVNQQCSVSAPLLDADRSTLIALAHSLYRRGGPALFMFSSQTDATAPTNTSATYRNVIFDAVTPGQARGFTVDRVFCNRKTTTTVPVKIECYAGMSAGSGNVRVVDGSGNTYATFAVSGAASWRTPVTANLPADYRMYYVEHQGDGANTVTTYAVSAFSYMP